MRLLGDRGVGKGTLVLGFVEGLFVEECDPLMDSLSQVFEVEGIRAHMDLLTMPSGQLRTRGPKGRWLLALIQYHKPPLLCLGSGTLRTRPPNQSTVVPRLVLVATQCDLEERQVETVH